MHDIVLPDRLIAADWSAFASNRAAWFYDSSTRSVQPLPTANELNLEVLVGAAEAMLDGDDSSVLIGLDLVLGVSADYFRAACRLKRWQGCRNFVDWLSRIEPDDRVWQPSVGADQWQVQQPFFSASRQGEVR